jgi:glutaryl-CoA dehydrogenase (non-decarboxylating)
LAIFLNFGGTALRIELTDQQKEAQAAFRAFAQEHIAHLAEQCDREERLPPELGAKLAAHGYLAGGLPTEYGGAGMDMVTYGLLCEEVGRACTSARSLLTVQGMVTQPLLKWGSASQKQHWLPRIARGEIFGAFAMTEPSVGSDALHITTTAVRDGESFVLNGRKKWISFGQIASVFLTFAQCEGKYVALLVERERPGITVRPIMGLIGDRAAMLAEIDLDNCRVPQDHLVAKVGFGFSCVASTGLDFGRYSVAWGCTGIAQACLDACLRYTSDRKQFDTYLKNHQFIQQMITGMVANLRAARLLCYQAGYQKDRGDSEGIVTTMIAKYFASTMVNRVASDAVQIHGASGCSAEHPVQRHMRDAKIMEIIEGTTQILQVAIAQNAYQDRDSLVWKDGA